MRTNILLLLSILTFLFSSCEDTNPNSTQLELSDDTFTNVNSNGSSLTLTVSSNASWTVSSDVQWCTPGTLNGAGNQELTLTIGANLNLSARTATVTVAASGIKKTVRITQQAGSSVADELHYKLPVIFHVLYTNPNDPKQTINKGRLAEILATVNQLYKDKSTGVDMNLEFTLATQTPKGEKLDEPGVEHILWNKEYPIDCEQFMTDNKNTYTYLLWDPNQYINVMIYNFKQESGSNTTTLGISHLPYSTTAHSLEGLNKAQQSYLTLGNLNFAYCVSINSLYIDFQSTPTEYNTADVNVTLAHELGHYLGLFHVFSEDEKGGILDGCKDTDYCKDTPTYNKVTYDASFDFSRGFNELVKREDCNKGEFISYNIMDYAVSRSDRFSVNQRERVRHVLTYSPLIPGPKKGQASTRSAVEGVLDLPIRVAR